MSLSVSCSWPKKGRRSSWAYLFVFTLVTTNIWTQQVLAASPKRRQDDAIAGGKDLRVLPIGDSITYGGGGGFCPPGTAAEKCNGYRKQLYESLSERGNDVSFVGSISAGDFAQPHCEGHRGERIKEITELSVEGINAAPNVVLLHAGTNDVKDDQDDYPDVHDHLQDLISLIYDASPDALVLLCTIIPADPENETYKETAARIPEFNDKIPDVVSYFEERNKKIRLVDMNSALEVDDLGDGLHPSLDGYEKMAATFLEAIEDAEDDISEPIPGTVPRTFTSHSRRRAGSVAQGARVGSHIFL